jgi:hypothetical protein
VLVTWSGPQSLSELAAASLSHIRGALSAGGRNQGSLETKVIQKTKIADTQNGS